MSGRGSSWGGTLMYGGPPAPAWPDDGTPAQPVRPIVIPAVAPTPLPADLTMVPAHVLDGLVKLLPALREALKGKSGDADQCAAVAFLEGVALQQKREAPGG